MMKELYDKIINRIDTRASLIALKQEIKDENNKRAFAYQLAGDYSELVKLLYEDDPKVRKNAAAILGEMECDEMLEELWNAYERETQMFVKAAYLKAMSAYEYEEYLPKLKDRLEILTRENRTEENKKHVREEIKVLQDMILKYEKHGRHSFRGFDREVDVILLTNREHRDVTRRQLQEEKTVLLAGGIRVRTKDVKALWKIRTFQEMLFPIPGSSLLPSEPEEAAKQLADAGLAGLLQESHKGKGPFRFRVDIRGRMEVEKKGSFIRKFSARLEEETQRACLNSTSDYEVELRLLEKKDGGLVPVLKLFTMPDKRFTYRKEVLAASIQPSNAALIMELLKPWLTEGAQVIDPFCGVGTLLIERTKIMAASPLYGIDIYPEAIDKARENAKAAGIIINYINRDCLAFQHEYRFDELITNMPVVSRTKTTLQIAELYEKFLEKIKEIMKPEGIVALYTTEESILVHALKSCSHLELQKKWVIREKEGSVLYLLKIKK